MKRFEMENTTSINNMRNHFNEVLKNLDKFGYNNFLKNNYFKNYLTYATKTLLSQWYDPTVYTNDTQSGWAFIGAEIDDAKYKQLNSFGNEFGINGIGTKLCQFIDFTNAERLANDGRFNLSCFYIRGESHDGINISLEYYSAVNTWSEITELDSITETISDVYSDPYSTITDDMVYEQITKVYDLSDYSTYDGKQLRMCITLSDAKWKILCNAVSYFGNMDASSFVRNMENNESIFTYDETAGDYYYSSDGKDKIFLSSGKYILTVGTYGQYSSINDAISSIANDNSSYGNSRIIYLTNDVTLTANTSISSNITILGNGCNISTGDYSLQITGTSGIANYKKHILIDNVKITNTSTDENVIPIDIDYADNITFRNCYYDGDFKAVTAMSLDYVINSNIDFREFKDYGYGSTKTGKGIDASNTMNTNINIQSLSLMGGTTYSSTDLIGVYVDSDTSTSVTTNIQNFTETV